MAFFFEKINFFKFHLFLVSLFIKEFSNKKKLDSYQKQSKKIITILVLDVDRFRGDIEIFSKDKNLRFLTISWSLLKYMLSCYIEEPTTSEKKLNNLGTGFRSKFRMSKPGSKIYKGRTEYRNFLANFLPLLFNKFRINVIMNSDFRYRREADICLVASKLGLSHICYYREALYISPAQYNSAVLRHKEYGYFTGKYIAVQNKVTKKMFLESGIATSHQIKIRGCPRMDNYIKKCPIIKKLNLKIKTKINRFLFLLILKGSSQTKSLYNVDFFKHCKKVISLICEFCKKHKDIRFVIKFKDAHLSQLEELKVLVKSINNGQIPEKIIFETDRMSAQKVILNSDVVVAMQSTIAIEAAISGLPVIMPHFNNLLKLKGMGEVLMYRKNHDLFDVPKNYSEFTKLLSYRLKNNYIENKITKKG